MTYTESLEYILNTLIDLVNQIKEEQKYYKKEDIVAEANYMAGEEKLMVVYYYNHQKKEEVYYGDLDEAAIGIFVWIQDLK